MVHRESRSRWPLVRSGAESELPGGYRLETRPTIFRVAASPAYCTARSLVAVILLERRVQHNLRFRFRRLTRNGHRSGLRFAAQRSPDRLSIVWSLADPACPRESLHEAHAAAPGGTCRNRIERWVPRVLVRDGQDYAATDAVERHREPALSVHYRVGRELARDQHPVSHECAESPPGQGIGNELTNASYFVAVPIELMPSRQIHRQ